MEITPGQPQTPLQQAQGPPEPVQIEPTTTWQASEFVHHEKQASWFIGVAAAGVVLVVLLAVFIDVVSAVVIALMFTAFILFAKRPPRVLNYGIGASGILIENKQYLFSELKSFSVRQEVGFVSAQLIPVKRFLPAISVYFSNEDAEKIVNILAEHLPHEDRQPDVVDRFFERLRF